jgi:hypothetical protein
VIHNLRKARWFRVNTKPSRKKWRAFFFAALEKMATKEAPIPFITFGKEAVINPVALEIISSIQGPISIVSVVGIYRSVFNLRK